MLFQSIAQCFLFEHALKQVTLGSVELIICVGVLSSV